MPTDSTPPALNIAQIGREVMGLPTAPAQSASTPRTDAITAHWVKAAFNFQANLLLKHARTLELESAAQLQRIADLEAGLKHAAEQLDALATIIGADSSGSTEMDCATQEAEAGAAQARALLASTGKNKL